MSIPFSPQKLRGEQRRHVIQAVQKRRQAEALEAIRRVATELLETEVTVKLGREKGRPRQVSQQAREIDGQCQNCGCRDAHYFTRDGHYRRELQTGWGQVQTMQVPMLECQKCQHDVVCEYAILEKHHPFWLDLDQDVLWSSGSCQSLREISERGSARLGSTVGLRTVNEHINQVELLVNNSHEQPIDETPEGMQLDGIWLTLQQETGAVR